MFPFLIAYCIRDNMDVNAFVNLLTGKYLFSNLLNDFADLIGTVLSYFVSISILVGYFKDNEGKPKIKNVNLFLTF